MSIQRLRNRFWVRLPNKERTPVGIYDTYDEAVAAEKLAIQMMGEQRGETLRKWGASWLDSREKDGVRDVATERNRWKTHIETATIIDRPLAMITPGDVEKWIAVVRAKKTATPRRKAAPIADKTVREVVGVLDRCFKAAMPKHVTSNPVEAPFRAFRRVVRRRGEPTEEPWTYLELDEQKRLASCVAIPETHRLMLRFAAMTGLRQGEQFNLELRDMRLDDPDPYVHVRFGSKGRPPKNGRPRRVYLSDDAIEVCKRWLTVLPGYAPENPSRLVFPGPAGGRMGRGKTPLHVSEWNQKRKRERKVDLFQRYLKLAGIKRQVRWHDLRHTCASSLVSGMWGRRWTLEEVREHLGHRSIQSTQRYAHLAASAIKSAVRATGRSQQAVATGHANLDEKLVATIRNDLVGRQGLEPWTYGLKALLGAEQSHELTPEVANYVATLRKRAHAALAAVDAGDPFAGAMLARLLEDLARAHSTHDRDWEVVG